nr:immunoglobulin light chain junction region [Mus musculus]NSL98456.1 immunoglobulin light chain junction region [Mus musculus]NSL99345.1 immunoglobulin light chain junction region [Mus musculus]NSL99774.1 immunoglobulin light chain junction region [Mus musculus]
CQQYSKLPFTF